MIIKKLLVVLVVLVVIPFHAQKKKDKVLLTIDNKPVYVSEFLRVYNKNKEVVSEENKKDLNEYLDLFINYKLKLKEAHDLKLDTVKSYLKEFKKYKDQLIEPYLKDRSVTDNLVKEAYDRTVKEVKASHVLINLKQNASPKDTLIAYNKVMDARTKIVNGKDFKEVAKKFSQDPSAKENGGDLGYFTAFSMVYPFENAAYNTKVGDVSMPFRTNFGYHIVKVVDIRESQGEIKVAHIMIKNKKDDIPYAQKQLEDIYQKFKQGEDFSFLAKTYSDDKQSGSKGGELSKFSRSKMLPSFAEVAFLLENVGDVSKPFKTKFGWHFVKLIEKYPLGSFEDLKDDLTTKIEKGDRSVMVGKSIANRLKKEYKVTVNDEVLQKVLVNDSTIINQTLITIKDRVVKANELQKFLKTNPSNNHKTFINNQVLSYYKDHLEDNNPEYAATLKEYRDGLLLFDLLQKKIWTKAEKDTIGLQNFYDKNGKNYIWKKRIEADIASCTKIEKAELVKKYLEEGKDIDQIKELVNEGATVHVLFTSGSYEIDSKKLPKLFESKVGVSKIFNEDDKRFTIVKVKNLLPSSQKELKDVKGKVISDYQDFLEKEWITKLRKTYHTEVNKKVFKKLLKKHK